MTTVAAFGGEGDKFYTCRRLTTPPEIDGIIDPGEWAGTDEAGPLVITKSDAAATLITRFRIGYDSERLYAAIYAQEPKMSEIKANVTRRDGEVWTDDAVELSVDPVHEHLGMVKFIVNSLGTLTDFRLGCYDWSSDAQTAAFKGKDYWSVEISVPFRDMDRPSPRPGEVWGLNVCREGREMQNWVNSYGTFTNPVTMGHMVFENPGHSLPTMLEIHKRLNYKLQPELQRHGPLFEGKPWSFLDNEVAEDQSLRTDLETPHMRMSGPFKEAPIRALVFVGVTGSGRDAAYESRVRDLVELRERFHVDPTAVYIYPSGVMGGSGGERRLRALLEEKWDVFVLAGCETKSIPDGYLNAIADRVSAGAGLVCVDNERDWLNRHGRKRAVPSEMLTGFPIKSLARYGEISKSVSGLAAGARPMIAAYTIGDGRALSISYGSMLSLTPTLPLSDENLLDHEYWIGLAGFAVDWAAGRQQPVNFLFPENAQLRRDSLPSNYNIGVSGSSAGKVRVEVFVRGSDGVRTLISKKDVDPKPAGEMQLAVPMPVLEYGPYYVEAQAWAGKSVVGFGAAKITVTSEDAIQQVDLDRNVVEPGKAITGSIKLATASGTARVELVTRDDRVLAQQDVPFKAPEDAKFSLTIGDDTTLEMRVRVSVLDEKGVIQSVERSFNVPNRCRDKFPFIMWNSASDVVGYYAYENLRKAGFNVCLLPERASYRANFSSVIYTTYISNKRDENGYTKQGCWYNEPWMTKYIADVAEPQRENWKRGVFVYSLGDESDTLGCCLHPADLAAYRKYLAGVYGTIDALNASWGEHYKSFDEVNLLKDDDFEKDSEAFKTGKYSRWLDRQRFAQVSFARLCGRYAKAFSEIDPKAITGFEGSGVFGDDVDALLEKNGMWTPYNGVLDDILRTIWPKGTVHGNWIGYSKDIDHLASVAWRSICLGANSIWWWRWEGTGWTRGFVSPTMDLWPVTKQLMKELEPVRDGLGLMLSSAEWEDDGVAILYSVESALADQIPTEEPFGKGKSAHAAFIHMLKDTGVQYKYVTPGRIAKGALKGVKVLMLPHAVALDPDTVKAIRSFVEAGGTVIADVRPAVMDGHGNALPDGALDDVFGVKRTGPGECVLLDSPTELKLNGTSFRISDLRAAADSNYSPAGASAGCEVNGIPLFFDNRFGKGRAILLNFTVESYEGFRDRRLAAEIRAPVLAVCESAGVRPTIQMESVSGGPLLMTELSRKSTSGGRIISLRTDYFNWEPFVGTPSPAVKRSRVRVKLDSPKLVYDLRNRKCLGRVSSFVADLKAGYANFYGLFDEPIAVPTVSCRTETVQGGTKLNATVRVGGPPTAVLIQLVDPSGNRPDWSRRVVMTKNGTAGASWQLPINGPRRYRIEARELFTGDVGSAECRM